MWYGGNLIHSNAFQTPSHRYQPKVTSKVDGSRQTLILIHPWVVIVPAVDVQYPPGSEHRDKVFSTLLTDYSSQINDTVGYDVPTLTEHAA